MKTLKMNGYKVDIYEGYNGDELFISKNGEKVYSARVHKGSAMNTAKRIVNK